MNKLPRIKRMHMNKDQHPELPSLLSGATQHYPCCSSRAHRHPTHQPSVLLHYERHLTSLPDYLQGLDTETAMPKAAQCIHGLSQLLDLLEQQSVDVSCLLWVAPFSSLLTTQQTVQQQFVAEVLPYLLVYCGCGLGPEGAQVIKLSMLRP